MTEDDRLTCVCTALDGETLPEWGPELPNGTRACKSCGSLDYIAVRRAAEAESVRQGERPRPKTCEASAMDAVEFGGWGSKLVPPCDGPAEVFERGWWLCLDCVQSLEKLYNLGAFDREPDVY